MKQPPNMEEAVAWRLRGPGPLAWHEGERVCYASIGETMAWCTLDENQAITSILSFAVDPDSSLDLAIRSWRPTTKARVLFELHPDGTCVPVKGETVKVSQSYLSAYRIPEARSPFVDPGLALASWFEVMTPLVHTVGMALFALTNATPDRDQRVSIKDIITYAYLDRHLTGPQRVEFFRALWAVLTARPCMAFRHIGEDHRPELWAGFMNVFQDASFRLSRDQVQARTLEWEGDILKVVERETQISLADITGVSFLWNTRIANDLLKPVVRGPRGRVVRFQGKPVREGLSFVPIPKDIFEEVLVPLRIRHGDTAYHLGMYLLASQTRTGRREVTEKKLREVLSIQDSEGRAHASIARALETLEEVGLVGNARYVGDAGRDRYPSGDVWTVVLDERYRAEMDPLPKRIAVQAEPYLFPPDISGMVLDKARQDWSLSLRDFGRLMEPTGKAYSWFKWRDIFQQDLEVNPSLRPRVERFLDWHRVNRDRAEAMTKSERKAVAMASLD